MRWGAHTRRGSSPRIACMRTCHALRPGLFWLRPTPGWTRSGILSKAQDFADCLTCWCVRSSSRSSVQCRPGSTRLALDLCKMGKGEGKGHGKGGCGVCEVLFLCASLLKAISGLIEACVVSSAGCPHSRYFVNAGHRRLHSVHRWLSLLSVCIRPSSHKCGSPLVSSGLTGHTQLHVCTDILQHMQL
jgi:hypothetical protein